MFSQAVDKLFAFFANPTLIGIAIALGFGIFWLLLYWPPMFKQASLWLVLLGSAILTIVAVAFIQVPLNELLGKLLRTLWSEETLLSRLLLVGLLSVLVGGLVQEGAKLAAVAIFWLHKKRTLEPKLGLLAGAVAGIGFGILEAQWVHNSLFAAGWTWGVVQTNGPLALLSFWERLFALGLHAGMSALAGYGLAKGKGWQYYLLAALIHGLANYSAYLLSAGVISILIVEIYLTVLASVLTVIMLSLRWEKKKIINSEQVRK